MSVWCASHRSLNTKLSLWTHDASESWGNCCGNSRRRPVQIRFRLPDVTADRPGLRVILHAVPGSACWPPRGRGGVALGYRADRIPE